MAILNLKDTIPLMVSEDYRDRLKAEYFQLVLRIKKLEIRLEEVDDELLAAQLTIMEAYRKILKERLTKEGIQNLS